MRLLWNMRRSPRRIERFGWWAVVLALLTLAVVSPALRPITFACWAAANVFFALAAWGWALFHPRMVGRGRESALKAAFWLALFGTLWAYSQTDRALAGLPGALPIPSSFLIGLVALGTWPLLFVTFFLLGLFGAALVVFASRKEAPSEATARSGVRAWWVVCMGAGVAVWLLSSAGPSDAVLPALFLGIPFFTVGLFRLAQRSPGRTRSPVMDWLDAWGRKLVWRVKWRGNARRLDLRGMALGLAAAALLLVLNSQALLMPMRTATLGSLLRVRAAIRSLATFQSTMLGENTAITREAGPQGSLSRAIPRDRFVLLEMDDSVRRDALTSRSEAALQAAMIHRLSAWGVTRIVLPVPLLTPPNRDSMTMTGAWLQGTPLPDAEEAARTAHDLPALLAAMRSAGNVTLADTHSDVVPGQPAKPVTPVDVSAVVGKLEGAAREVGNADLTTFHTSQLIAVPTRWTHDPPLPILLASGARGTALSVRTLPGDRVQIAGVSMPRIAPDTVLPELLEGQATSPFPHVPYSSVLHGDLVYGQPVTGTGTSRKTARWMPPKAFFKDKIVFLDTLLPDRHETSAGVLPRAEIVAGVTAALLAGDTIARPDPQLWVLWVLLLGAVTGAVCTRRPPLDGLWRVSIVLFCVVAYAFSIFIGLGEWLDPIVPAVTIGAAFLLATQLTFALEHGERERNRALLQRFVAPQVVEEFLDSPEKLGLGGVRRRVCVLFADVRNFTGFAEQHTPEEVIGVTNLYMTAMTDALDRYGGILDKYTGDGLMALFPVTHEAPREEVERAVWAALAMRDAAQTLSEQRTKEGKLPLNVGIGMHYGEAVLGIVGNPVRQINYTALGYTVVISARLQTLAAGGEVVVSDAIYQEVASAFRMEGGEPVRVKGVSVPVQPYRVLAPQPPMLPAPETHPVPSSQG